jgi:alpha-glucoside transport system permease protein
MDRILLAAFTVLIVPVLMVGYILLVEGGLGRLNQRTATRVRPWLWLLPALAFVVTFLIYPTIATIIRSFYNQAGDVFVGVDNYTRFFTTPATLDALKNNVLWMILLPVICVGFGLVLALLVDRVRYESFAKSVIFLPMAISFVAASIIWRLVYNFDPNIGILNAGIVAFGGDAVPWLTTTGLTTYALIVVGAWMQTGFAMVILSAGLKGISTELIEAARVDGATELQVFRRIVFPLLLPTIAVITTTLIIFALKTFDVVYVLGQNGNFGTEVIANRMYKELFSDGQPGRASATSVILLLAVIPIMIYNIRRFREQEAIR